MKMLRAAVLTLFLATAAHAATVSGIIESTTWTVDQSPYYVVDTVLVAEGAVLNIEAGVDVLFDADVPFLIEGALIASGTETDSVRFLPGESATWQGLSIETGYCHLYYTRISGAEKQLGTPVFDGRGGAIRAVGAVHVDLHNVVLTHNRAFDGGAVYAGDSAHVQMQNCLVIGNAARHAGAGVRVQNDALLEAMNSEFSRNIVDDPSLEINEGGGIMVWNANAVLSQCVIRGNNAGRGGGGGIRAVGGYLELFGCEVSANSIRPTPNFIPYPLDSESNLSRPMADSHPISIRLDDSVVLPVLPRPAGGLRFGGGIWLSDDASMTMEQCTVAMNTAEETGGIGVHASRASISRSIVYMNEGRNLIGYVDGTIHVEFSNVPAPSSYYPWPGEGNLNVDPLFVDSEAGDFTLRPESPCWFMGAYPLDEGSTPPEPPVLTEVDSDSVSGVLGTMTWTSENSPYRVVGPVRVAPSETLTIEAGVDVLFDADVPFIVNGALTAIGTETDSIRFLPGEAEEWGGLRIIGGESNEIAYTRISGGNADGYLIDGYGGGIFLYNPNTRLVLTHSVISDNDAFCSGGMIVGGHSWAHISYT
ncbi:MAG TPA: hypothetical protein ENN56_02755, partial [Firmicutes bacterium]|nr:hypothetical protein [Bacillota bacterium]